MEAKTLADLFNLLTATFFLGFFAGAGFVACLERWLRSALEHAEKATGEG